MVNKLFCKRQKAKLVSDNGNQIAVKKRTKFYNFKGTFQDAAVHTVIQITSLPLPFALRFHQHRLATSVAFDIHLFYLFLG